MSTKRLLYFPDVEIQTTDATPTVLTSYTMAPDSIWYFDATIIGRRSSVVEGAVYKARGALRRDGTAGCVFIGSIDQYFTAEDDISWGWVLARNNPSLGDVRISVIGVAAIPIYWSARIEIIEFAG